MAKVYINLIDQKEPTLNFQVRDEKMSESYIKNTSYFKKVIQITDEEKNNHSLFLKTNLKKNYFN